VLTDGETPDCLPADYRFHLSDGHTPGMLLTEIPLEDGPVVYAADLIPGAPWVHVPITMGYDRFRNSSPTKSASCWKACWPGKGACFLPMTRSTPWPGSTAMPRAVSMRQIICHA
jgi:hypothetical protein